MSIPFKLFLDYDSFREEWKVLNQDGKCFGCGCCPEEAIKSARLVTNAPIYANSQFKGIIDGTPIIPVINTDELSEDSTIYGAEEIIEVLAELGGFKVRKVQDDEFILGYAMELVE